MWGLLQRSCMQTVFACARGGGHRGPAADDDGASAPPRQEPAARPRCPPAVARQEPDRGDPLPPQAEADGARAAFRVDPTPAADHHRAMCGRFLLNSPLVELQRAFRFPERPNLWPRYNVAPTQTVPIVRRRRDGEGRELALVRWGLVPFWAKDLSIGSKMINARAEGIAEQARLPGGVQGAPLPGARRRLLRVAEGRGRQAADADPAALGRALRVRRPVGEVARARRARRDVHDRHHGAERRHRADPQPDAGDPRPGRL